MRWTRRFVLLILIACAVPTVAAKDRACTEIGRQMVGVIYIAKEPLYDTVIGYDGIIKLERDKEEIRAGATCRVKDVECGRKKVEVTLKQVAGGREFNKVEIVFRIGDPERNTPEGMEAFQKMLSYVLEKPEADSSTETTKAGPS